MTRLRVLLSAARRTDPEELDNLLAQGIDQVDGAITEMRRLIADLRPTTLDELGLAPALEALGVPTMFPTALEKDREVRADVHVATMRRQG